MIIIGILAAIAIPTFLNQRQNAVGSGQVADLRSVADEVEGFYVNTRTSTRHVVGLQSGETGHDQRRRSGTGLQRVTVGNTVSVHARHGRRQQRVLPRRDQPAGRGRRGSG